MVNKNNFQLIYIFYFICLKNIIIYYISIVLIPYTLYLLTILPYV